jgi:CRP-like cAMP-binding protein
LSALLTSASFRPGETIFLAREPGDTLFVIVTGSVRIWVHDADANVVTLAELGPGDFFGEMAVVDGGSRSANASALAECQLACLRRQTFEDFLAGHPQAALDVIRGIGTRLRRTNLLVSQRVARNANVVYESTLSHLDRLAMTITQKVGSVTFFLIILTWTVLWTGYNLMASLVPSFGWWAFDPFPAFVAYLLMSNVIQILLMPLILVGQNLQSRHAETRAELDFETNQRAEKEVMAALLHLERNTGLLLTLMRHLDCRAHDESVAGVSGGTSAARE